jgi:hypothetical protein
MAPRSAAPGARLHLGVDAETGEIVAAELTANAVDDGAQVGPLLDQVAGPGMRLLNGPNGESRAKFARG